MPKLPQQRRGRSPGMAGADDDDFAQPNQLLYMVCGYGKYGRMSALRKVTVNLPGELLDDLMEQGGMGVTDTIRDALETKRRRLAVERVLELRGGGAITESWEVLRGNDEPEKEWL